MASGFVRPPELEGSIVAKLILAVFSFKEVEESSVKQLPSYEDRNYYLTGVTNCGRNGNREGEFVLKISNSLKDVELKMGLNAVVSHLYQQGFECPQPLSSRNEKGVEMLSKEQLLAGDPGASEGEGPKFCVQLLTFIPGKTMESIPFTPRLAYDAGRYVGSMDAVLQGFRHPAIDCQEFPEPAWTLEHFLHLKKHLPSVKDPEKKKIVERVLGGFETHVQPKINSMKCGTIHGDPYVSNIIVRMQNEEYHVTGIIDFCDCSNSCCVFDLAIILTSYALSEIEDPVRSTGPVLCGYLAAFPLSEEEIGCLYHLILARLCQQAVLSDIQLIKDPRNSYLASIPGPAWKLAEELVNTPKEEVDRIWAEARMQWAVFDH